MTNTWRRLVGFLLATTLAAFALPALAAKEFRMDYCAGTAACAPPGPTAVSPVPPAAVVENTIILYYKNVGTESSFDSITIQASAPGFTVKITSASAPAPKVGDPSGYGTALVTLGKLSPVKVPNKEVPITVKYTVERTGANVPTCGATLSFTGTAWTGSNPLAGNFANVGGPVQVAIDQGGGASFACTTGTLTDCANEPSPTNFQFNASLPGATTLFDTGYGAGFQTAIKTFCPDISFVALNYLSGGGAGNLVDAAGRLLPPNSFSIVVTFSTAPMGHYALSYSVTSAPQKSNEFGEPATTVKYCAEPPGGNCVTGSRKDLLSCVGPQVAPSALPLVGGEPEPACKTGESYLQTAPADCGGMLVTDPDWLAGVRCLIRTVWVTDVKDPPIQFD